MRDPKLEQMVATLYSDTLPYHNFGHALTVTAAGEEIVRRCHQEGIRIEDDVVYYALLFHDAGYHEDHLALGYASKEAYSAQLARDMLAEFGIGPSKIAKVAAAIMSTMRDASFRTTEQKAVRAADLSGLAADYPTFLHNSRLLRREIEILTGKPLTWSAWVAQVARTMQFYLGQEIRLTSYYVNDQGESAFHRAVEKNLAQLLREPEVVSA